MNRATSAGRWSWLLAVAAAPMLTGAATAQSPAFSLRVLSAASGENWGMVYGINNVGQAVGVASGSVCPNGCPVVWLGGTATVLGAVNGAFAYGPLAINDVGQVVGTVELSGTIKTFQAVAWNSGTPMLLASPSSQYASTYAVSINDAGLVVGSATRAGNVDSVPVEWNGTTPTVLGFAPGYRSGYAKGVNDNGLIVGEICCKPMDGDAVEWQGTTPTLLATANTPHPGGTALAANNSGLVVGAASNAAGATHAAAWSDGSLTDLGTLATGTASSATAVNAGGVIVGKSDTVGAAESHATLWGSVGAAPQDLNKLISPERAAEFDLTGATGINDNCVIVVNGFNRKTGNNEAFALTLTDQSSCLNGTLIQRK